MTEKTQGRLEITSSPENQVYHSVATPILKGKIIITGEVGLEVLLGLVRSAWEAGYPLVITDVEEIRFEEK